jgi:hypothetical protein
VIALSVLFFLLMFYDLYQQFQPLPFCTDLSEDEKCRPCPEHGKCSKNNVVCLSPTIEKHEFCVIPGSLEDEALSHLLEVVKIPVASRDPEVIASNMKIDLRMAQKAVEFSERSGFSCLATQRLLMSVVGFFASLGFCVFLIIWRSRAISEHKTALQILNFLETSHQEAFSMPFLCHKFGIRAAASVQLRILKRFQALTQYDIDLKAMTISRCV